MTHAPQDDRHGTERSPTAAKPSPGTEEPAEPESRSIPAFHPSHVWSMDLTEVFCWGLWQVSIIVVIDHFSPEDVSVKPLVSQRANGIIAVMEEAFRAFGPPKHLISDQQSGFASAEVANFLEPFGVKQRFGAVGKHGSIAVTERVNRTLKEEWLCRVPLIRGVDHLAELCSSFVYCYNDCCVCKGSESTFHFRNLSNPLQLEPIRSRVLPQKNLGSIPSNVGNGGLTLA